MTMAATRHWPLPDTHNFRDLGGYARASGGMTHWARLLRGESPHYLRDDSVAQLAERGLALVIDLRGPHETADTPHPFREHPGIEYRNIVLFDALAPIAMTGSFDMARRYCSALDECGPQLAEVMRTIITAPPGMVLFHCTAGKDRTGIVAALVLLAADVAPDDVAADYALTGSATGLIEKLRARAIEAGGQAEHIERVLASDAQTMMIMLDHLEHAHGGINDYLSQIGLSRSEIEQLVDRLCA